LIGSDGGEQLLESFTSLDLESDLALIDIGFDDVSRLLGSAYSAIRAIWLAVEYCCSSVDMRTYCAAGRVDLFMLISDHRHRGKGFRDRSVTFGLEKFQQAAQPERSADFVGCWRLKLFYAWVKQGASGATEIGHDVRKLSK